MYRAELKQLRNLLPDPNDPATQGWRLVDHIAEVKTGSNVEHSAAAEQILQVWQKVDALLIEKAGLNDSVPPPASFGQALAHSSLLRLYWRLGLNEPARGRLPFNGQDFDSDIDAAIARISTRLRKLGEDIPIVGATP